MLAALLPYLLILFVAIGGGILLTSKTVAERCVSAGLLPRAFLGFLPIIQLVLRIVGGVLVCVGILQISLENGWLNRALLQRYAFPAVTIVLGLALLLLSRRSH